LSERQGSKKKTKAAWRPRRQKRRTARQLLKRSTGTIWLLVLKCYVWKRD